MPKKLELLKKYLKHEVLFTSVAWALFMGLVGWSLVALGWWAIAYLFWHELFVPASVKTTALSVILLGLWGLVVFALFLIWSNFNYRKYYQKNNRRYQPLPNGVQPLGWVEASIDPAQQFLDENKFIDLEIVTPL